MSLNKKTKLQLLVPLLYAAVVTLYFLYSWPDNVTPRHVIAAVITYSAFTFWIISRITLGDSFSLKPKAKHLVSGGVYSKLRHPVYYFSILAASGLTLYVWHFLAAVLLSFLILLEVWRIRKEEEILLDRFGAQYVDYKAKTWF